MQKLFLVSMLVWLTITCHGQTNITINKTVTLDDAIYKSLRQNPMTMGPMQTFKADKFINDLMSDFTFYQPFYEGHPTTLYVFPNPKSSSDSILVAENSDNKYVFKRSNNKWLMSHFSITVSGFTLNHLACGQTSKEALKKMGVKIKEPINNGQVLVSNSAQTCAFLLSFANDKLVKIQL